MPAAAGPSGSSTPGPTPLTVTPGSTAASAVQNTLVALTAAISIPALIDPRIGSNEAAAIGALRTITTAQSLFREGDKDKNGILDYSQSVGTLSTYNLIDNQLGTGEKQGYLFTIGPHTTSPNWQFEWSAEAVMRKADWPA